MPISRQVTCINKTNRTNPHERIQNIGGTWGKVSVAEAIVQINNNTFTYHVKVGGYDVKVIVAYHNGNPYLKTVTDTTTTDNLLSLPNCP